MTKNFPDKSNWSQPSASNREDVRGPMAHALAADEIDSLLKMARETARKSDPPNEDLGPGDVQYLRGDSEAASQSAIESSLAAKLFGVASSPDRVIDQVQQDLDALADFSSPSPVYEVRQNDRLPSDQTVLPSDGLTIEDLGDVDLDISIELGRTEILIEEILKLREGSVVALDKLAGDPVDIVANGRLVARGELLVIDGKFGVRLSEVL